MSKNFVLKRCSKCGGSFGPEDYTKTKSPFYDDGYLPICNDCLSKILIDCDYNWEMVDKLCQYAGVPFVPSEFEKLHEWNGDKVFPVYCAVVQDEEYSDIDWGDYYRRYKDLIAKKKLENELPGFKEERRKELQKRWGANYDDEGLQYLEDLYNGLMMTQNVSGALQVDQALKICKISYVIDSKIRGQEDFDKLLSSYDKLVKTAEFTPKNVKSINDFDSVGELIKWLEKKGWKNPFYDGVTRDIVDETMKNMENYNQRLYTQESGIGDEITRRIEALQTAKQLENYYDTDKEYDLDNYDTAGYDELMKEEEEADFEADLEGDDI